MYPGGRLQYLPHGEGEGDHFGLATLASAGKDRDCSLQRRPQSV